jgi:hypothetical protein
VLASSVAAITIALAVVTLIPMSLPRWFLLLRHDDWWVGCFKPRLETNNEVSAQQQ